MNKARRKRITDIVAQVCNMKDELEEIIDDEQEAFENMPESLQESERGQAMDAAVDAMSEVRDELDTMVGSLDELVAA